MQDLCKDYITDAAAEFCICATDAEIEAERVAEYTDAPLGLLESVAVYRKIALELPKYDAFLFHAATVEVDGEAYAFAAKSGTGKSTHIRLWKKLLGDRVQIINGDKPIVRIENKVPVVYGTPWAGKEGWQRNACAPLKAVCFLERAQENSIESLPFANAVSRFMGQVLHISDEEYTDKLLNLTIGMLKNMPVYLLRCNISEEAATLAYEKMK